MQFYSARQRPFFGTLFSHLTHLYHCFSRCTFLWREEYNTSFPLFRHRGGDGNKTPPSMHQGRCLGWTCDDTSKEAKLHGRQCPSSCVITSKSFRGFTLTRPRHGAWLLLFRRSMREIYCPKSRRHLFRLSSETAKV